MAIHDKHDRLQHKIFNFCYNGKIPFQYQSALRGALFLLKIYPSTFLKFRIKYVVDNKIN
jgi:hypothetical protein